LALEKYADFALGVVDCQDDDRTGVLNDLSDCGYTVWLDDTIAPDVENAAAKDGPGGENFGLWVFDAGGD